MVIDKESSYLKIIFYKVYFEIVKGFGNVFNCSFLEFSRGFPSLYIPSPVYTWLFCLDNFCVAEQLSVYAAQWSPKQVHRYDA